MARVSSNIIARRLAAEWPDKRVPLGGYGWLADRLHVSKDRVGHHARALGYSIDHNTPGMRVHEAARMAQRGMSITQIMEAMGVDRHTVTHYLVEARNAGLLERP